MSKAYTITLEFQVTTDLEAQELEDVLVETIWDLNGQNLDCKLAVTKSRTIVLREARS